MSDRKLTLCFLFLIPILGSLFVENSVIDLAVWIAQGNYFLAHHHLPLKDVFSALPTREFIFPSYAVCIFYAFLNQLIGLKGVCLFHKLVILPLLLTLIYRTLIKENFLPGNLFTRLLLLAFWTGGFLTYAARPGTIALLLAIYSYQLILKIDDHIDKKTAVKLFLLELIWVNLHGSFVLLPMMLTWKIFFQFNHFKNPFRSLVITFCIFAASLINPFGYKVFTYLIETARASRNRGLGEWLAPTLSTNFPQGFLFWTLFAVSIYFLWQQFRKHQFLRSVANPFFLILILGATSTRNVAIAFTFLLPAAGVLGLLKPQPRNDSIVFQKNSWIAATLILSILLTPYFKPWQWDNSVSPGLAQTIREDGRNCAILNDFNLGSFLMLELPNPIYLDTRNIIYTDKEFLDYEKTLKGDVQVGDAFLAEGNACFVLVSTHSAAAFIERLSRDPAWQFKGTEGEYVLYAKKK